MQENVQHNLHEISGDTTADGFFFLEELRTLNKGNKRNQNLNKIKRNF